MPTSRKMHVNSTEPMPSRRVTLPSSASQWSGDGAGGGGVTVRLLALLRAVLAAAALAAVDAERVQRPADDVIPHARQVAHAPAADEDDRVFLKVVLLAGDVGGDFLAVA